MTNTAVTLRSALRSSYDVVTMVFVDTSDNTYTAAVNLQDAGFAAPAAPSVAVIGTGGTATVAGTYNIRITYVDANGESAGSGTTSVVTTGTTSTTTISSPSQPSQGTATGWYAYVSTVAAPTVLTRQQTYGSPTAIGTPLALIAPPTTSGDVIGAFATDTPVTNLVRAFFAA